MLSAAQSAGRRIAHHVVQRVPFTRSGALCRRIATRRTCQTSAMRAGMLISSMVAYTMPATGGNGCNGCIYGAGVVPGMGSLLEKQPLGLGALCAMSSCWHYASCLPSRRRPLHEQRLNGVKSAMVSSDANCSLCKPNHSASVVGPDSMRSSRTADCAVRQ